MVLKVDEAAVLHGGHQAILPRFFLCAGLPTSPSGGEYAEPKEEGPVYRQAKLEEKLFCASLREEPLRSLKDAFV